MAIHFNRGANAIFQRALKQKGTPPPSLPVADVTQIQVELIQKNEVLKTYVYNSGGDWPDGLRAIDAATIQLQLDSATSEALCEGPLLARWIIRFPNDQLVVDDANQVDPIPEVIGHVH